MAQPTIPQMLTRMNGGHTYILRVLSGVSEPRPLCAAEGRGVRTARDTLVKWGCVSRDGLTERGRELLATWQKRDAECAARNAADYDRLYGTVP